MTYLDGSHFQLFHYDITTSLHGIHCDFIFTKPACFICCRDITVIVILQKKTKKKTLRWGQVIPATSTNNLSRATNVDASLRVSRPLAGGNFRARARGSLVKWGSTRSLQMLRCKLLLFVPRIINPARNEFSCDDTYSLQHVNLLEQRW